MRGHKVLRSVGLLNRYAHFAMADNAYVRVSAPVSLSDCSVQFMSDGSAYLVDRTSNERVCRAYGFDKAGDGWRSLTSFWTKDGEEGFWAAFDDREVTRTLD